MNEEGFCSECRCYSLCKEVYDYVREGSRICREIKVDNGERIILGLDSRDMWRLLIDSGGEYSGSGNRWE